MAIRGDPLPVQQLVKEAGELFGKRLPDSKLWFLQAGYITFIGGAKLQVLQLLGGRGHLYRLQGMGLDGL